MSPLGRYVVRRIAFACLLLFVVSSGAMLLAAVAPGDVTAERVGRASAVERARERARLGLDRPVVVQYGAWLSRAVRLDFGTSLRYGRPVGELVRERAWNSVMLAGVALAGATLVGIPLGVVAGSRPERPVGRLIAFGSSIGVSLPPLLLALLLAFVAARTGWLRLGPSAVAAEGAVGAVVDLLSRLALPALALAIPLAATLERLQAQALGEALDRPFVAASLARGVPWSRIVWRDALRLAVAPVAGVYGILVGGLLSGSFAVEVITAWPGLGRLMYDALLARDIPLVAGCAAAGGLFLAAATLASDVVQAIADPRLRNEG